MSCIHCLEKSGTSRCGGCHVFVYCSKECQSSDWIAHHAKECAFISGVKRPREEDVAPLSEGELFILNNPRRLKAAADSYSIEDLRYISTQNGPYFYGQLNQSNLFWYFVAARLTRDYNAPVSYREVSLQLLADWK